MKPGAKMRRIKLARDRAAREAADLSAGGRHRLDVSEREAIEASRMHRPLAGAAEAVNAQLQTPEAWAALWSDVVPERNP